MSEALAPFRSQLIPSVHEREILRVVATIGGNSLQTALAQARREILIWAQNRIGGELPKQAWDGETFETFFGGRNAMAARIVNDEISLWAFRVEDPDKYVPGRIWTTEITIGSDGIILPQISVRLIVSTSEHDLKISPHVPGFVRQIYDRLGLRSGGFALSPDPWVIRTDEDIRALVDLLESKQRKLTVIVASGDDRSADPRHPSIEVNSLARATLGLAHVVVIPASKTYSLSDIVGRIRSVFHGAVRTYFPGFDSASDPYEHRLYFAESICKDPENFQSLLRLQVSQESLRRTHLGKDVLSFASVRSAVLRYEQTQFASRGASEADQLRAARRQIDALEAEVQAAKAYADQTFQTAAAEEDRAKLAEARWNSACLRISSLERALKSRGITEDEFQDDPARWSDFSDWADRAFVGRLVLAPIARRGLKRAMFSDISLAAGCLKWLASTCLERRINGGGFLANIPIGRGIENAPCGGDAFEFEFHGRKLNADWHIKSGGNTRDPSRCLRIYYTFDELTQQIVVADMPAHRKTDAS